MNASACRCVRCREARGEAPYGWSIAMLLGVACPICGEFCAHAQDHRAMCPGCLREVEVEAAPAAPSGSTVRP